MKNIYEITQTHSHNVNVIRVLEGEFKNVEYTYGSVAVQEQDGIAILKFEYNLIAGEIKNIEAFKTLSGDILQDLIYDQLETSSVIYKGGTD